MLTLIATSETTRPRNDQPKPRPNAANEVIVIDSSDSEDELAAMITDDMKSQKANQNNNTTGEILISVQTKPIRTDEA